MGHGGEAELGQHGEVEQAVGAEAGRPGLKAGKGRKRNSLSFSNFSKANFEMQIQTNLNSDFKPDNTKIICSNMNA